jgi:hypothetical protein
MNENDGGSSQTCKPIVGAALCDNKKFSDASRFSSHSFLGRCGRLGVLLFQCHQRCFPILYIYDISHDITKCRTLRLIVQEYFTARELNKPAKSHDIYIP